MDKVFKGSHVIVQCQFPGCGKDKMVRLAEIERGWGKYCSRECKKADMVGKPRNKERKPRIRQSDKIN
jgi:hypothetical protein